MIWVLLFIINIYGNEWMDQSIMLKKNPYFSLVTKTPYRAWLPSLSTPTLSSIFGNFLTASSRKEKSSCIMYPHTVKVFSEKTHSSFENSTSNRDYHARRDWTHNPSNTLSLLAPMLLQLYGVGLWTRKDDGLWEQEGKLVHKLLLIILSYAAGGIRARDSTQTTEENGWLTNERTLAFEGTYSTV